MTPTARQRGFSLTEVLLATGVLAVGFVMIAMVFPVGIWLTSVAAEQTIGPVAAQEAQAKVRLYGVDMADPWWGTAPAWTSQFRIFDGTILDPTTVGNLTALGVDPNDRLNEESFYPSLPREYYDANTQESRKYRSTVLCRRTGPVNWQLRIFVCRKGVENITYHAGWFNNANGDAYEAITGGTDWPMPVRVRMLTTAVLNEINVDPAAANQVFPIADIVKFFTDDCEIVDDKNGNIYRVIERKDSDGDRSRDTLVLEQPWDMVPAGTPEFIWVVPPARGSGKNPCIGIYGGDI